MKTSIKRFMVSGLLAVVVALAGLAAVQAGSTNEFGQLAGTPAEATYVALAKAGAPPSEVLTEDGYNSAAGPNQGYQSLFWLIKVGAGGFASPAAAGGDTVHMVFNEPVWRPLYP